ncbi:MAG: ATP-dependent 6-phosphofructokinase [Flammeovirgaceae bacterium]|nr:ATP-dependent 6-phosphofructokinase [Flammeovirgaceae bacterium]MDW8288533.1 ATP-dependent 6-phosphofructokinase [Flammeovirgaceae bacterium]
MSKKKVLVLTGGGDCPGLNAVIRGIVKRAQQEKDWEVWGSYEAYNGVLKDPMELMLLDNKAVAGIHVRGGTIIGTTNKGGPFSWPVQMPDGTWKTVDRSDDLVHRLNDLGIEAIISIGGDGSQRISLALQKKGLRIVGVPKTIDNDLSATDFTFGFQTAVQIATESFDKLVTTAASHHRVIIMEVMGRSAGWIALHTAIAGGAEICLIPEIPYDVHKLVKRIDERYDSGKGFVNIVVAEGAKPKDGTILAKKSDEVGYENLRLGGVAYQLSHQLKEAGCKADIRETVLGHIQRGGTPVAFDRILATQFGVKAFEMVLDKEYGRMVAYKNNDITTVTLEEAVSSYNYVNLDSYLIKAARGVGISFGD